MNYQEMSDEQIEFAVSDALGIPRGDKWCSDWADAGPIIQDNGISLYHYYDGRWDAEIEVSAPIGAFGTDEICVKFATHKNPLRAAMIVFLMMKGGE